MGGRIFTVGRNTISETDLVRSIVILSFTICSILISAIAFSRSIPYINYQLFFIPIVYAAYFYPRKGIYVAAVCGVVYQAVGYYYSYPDSVAMLGVTAEALLFVIIAIVIAYFIEKIRSGEARYRTVFEHSQLGIVLFNREGFSVRQTNDKFAAMLNYSEQEILASVFTDLFFIDQEKERFLDRIDKHRETTDFETRLAAAGGAACWVNLSWSMIDDHTVSCTAININARKLAEKLNNDNMMKYRQLTEHSPTSILIVVNGVILYANPTFEEFSGYGAPEVIGKELVRFLDPRDLHTYSEFAQHWISRKPVASQGKFRFIRKDGGIRVAILFTNPIVHANKPATMINLMDVSEKLRLEEKIQLDNDRRRGIIITVAHELRTPLQPILGYLDMLITDPDGFGITDDTKKILERCLVSVDRERQIINQMLELSVLESGKLQLSRAAFPLERLVHDVIDTSGYLTKADISVTIPGDIMLSADRDRIYNVFDSLLSNAINYSKPPRNVEVFYRMGSTDEFHHISIRDNGIGIPPESIENIFEPFQLADAAKLSRKYDRIGLSLSNAKKVIQLHGGDITVESVVNGGSTFTLHLPKVVKSDA
ncbi:MAG: PAS domain-containing sensor histidine kinase [Methanoregula sp.]|jgi:PAS domain S-box-containing protein|nr:PAS domain-containing sensor histidine kinase [Methanoregula sp.]